VTPILETRDLVRRFGGGVLGGATVRAVDGVSIAVRPGETYAVVGESGCGKSTLARMLIRLIEPSEGQVLYDGRDISHLSERRMRRLRRDLQFVFQDPFSALNPRMTVGALVDEPMRVHGLGSRAERRAEVARLLARVGLRPEHAGRYPHEFSGGQRQRIGVARALATRPKVLIGDEPVSALDVSVQAQVVNLLESLKDEFGLTLIVIAHDLAVIRHMSDRVAVMYLGEVVEEGPTEAVFSRPRHPYTRALLAAIPRMSPDAPAREAGLVEGEPPNPVDPPPGCRFHPRCPFVQARCRTDRPPPMAAEPERRAACWFHDEVAQAAPPQAAPPRAAALETRLALYRARSRQAEQAEP
jgi:peptide/nickel transport system ATP-binding protein